MRRKPSSVACRKLFWIRKRWDRGRSIPPSPVSRRLRDFPPITVNSRTALLLLADVTGGSSQLNDGPDGEPRVIERHLVNGMLVTHAGRSITTLGSQNYCLHAQQHHLMLYRVHMGNFNLRIFHFLVVDPMCLIMRHACVHGRDAFPSPPIPQFSKLAFVLFSSSLRSDESCKWARRLQQPRVSPCILVVQTRISKWDGRVERKKWR